MFEWAQLFSDNGIIENAFSYLILAYFNWLLSSPEKEYIVLKVYPSLKQQSKWNIFSQPSSVFT